MGAAGSDVTSTGPLSGIRWCRRSIRARAPPPAPPPPRPARCPGFPVPRTQTQCRASAAAVRTVRNIRASLVKSSCVFCAVKYALMILANVAMQWRLESYPDQLSPLWMITMTCLGLRPAPCRRKLDFQSIALHKLRYRLRKFVLHTSS